MTDIVHTDIFDNGFSVLTGIETSICICQTEPLTLADCTNESGSGGKRVTTIETIAAGNIVVSDGVNNKSRKISIPSAVFNNGVTVAVTGSPDLWIAVFDGTRLLYRSNQIVNRDLPLNATITSPVFVFEIRQ